MSAPPASPSRTLGGLAKHAAEHAAGAALEAVERKIRWESKSPNDPAQQYDGYERLRLDITVEGNVDELDAALAALSAARPLVYIASVRVKQYRGSGSNSFRRHVQSGNPNDPRKLTARLELFALGGQQ